MSLITDYPFWYIILCIALGIICTYVLYKPKNGLDEISTKLLWLLSASRFILITFLAFFLLSPLLKWVSNRVEKPVLIFASDNSQSIILNKDSLYYKGVYQKDFQDLISKLSQKFEVKQFNFGDKVTTDKKVNYQDKETDFSTLFEELEASYTNTNVGAIIIASDGLYNKGTNPIYALPNLNCPVFTIALGDTTIKKDLILEQVQNNRIAYLGNKFPIKVSIKADKLAGKKFQLKITDSKGLSQTKDFTINSTSFETETTLEFEAKQLGIQKYTVTLSRLDGEASYVNNSKSVFIDVIDSRQKVLILAAAPHPDVAAIKSAISKNENYEVESHLIDDFKKSVEKYNLVILHQLPSKYNSAVDVFDVINKKGIGSLYILGNSSSLNLFNKQKTGLTVKAKNTLTTNVFGKLNKNFSLFTVDNNFEAELAKLPPLQAFFGDYNSSTDAKTFLNQKIGTVETDKDLILFSQKNDSKQGVIAGEGLWRWKMQDFANNQNNNWFNGFVNKLVQYLSIKVDKSQFRILSKNDFNENENIQFTAEIYNDSYELITDPEINLKIKNKDGKEYNFTFSKNSNYYLLNAGVLPVGEYSYSSIIKLGKKSFTQKGQFSVSPIVVEAVNTTANHKLLNQLATANNGAMVYPNQLNQLEKLIKNREDITDIIYEDKSFRELINLKWIFFLLLTLLSLEWFARKRNGGY